jgi:hypothetical protein
MRKFLLAAAMAVSFVTLSSAQTFEVGIDGGYGLGLGDSVGSKYQYDTNGNVVKWEDLYSSMGKGIKVTGQATFYINESFGIMGMAGYSGKIFGIGAGGYTTEMSYPTWGNKNTIETSCFQVNLGIKIRGSAMGKIRPYVYIAPGIYFPKREETQAVTGIFGTNDPDDKVVYKFSTGLGFTAGLGAVYSLTDNIGIKLEFSPTYAYANITEYTFTQVTGYGTTTTTYVFTNDATTIPNSTGSKQYRRGQPRRTFNSVALRLGMTYGF